MSIRRGVDIEFRDYFAPRPAAHSIFKNPREIDENACPPLAERIGGGAGRARSRIGPLPYKATTRAERARSGVGKIGSSVVV